MSFWLLGEKDADPAKKDPYARWGRMRDDSSIQERP
jgi:hypothetical protein